MYTEDGEYHIFDETTFPLMVASAVRCCSHTRVLQGRARSLWTTSQENESNLPFIHIL